MQYDTVFLCQISGVAAVMFTMLNRTNVIRLLSSVFAVLLLAGCQNLPQQSHSTAPVSSGTVQSSSHTQTATSVATTDASDNPATSEKTNTIPAGEATSIPLKQPKIALVLGGGGARGFAHVGVIKSLEEHGIYPDMVVGTSAGSLVGAIYAAGNDHVDLMKIAATMNEAAISDWSFPFFSGITGLLKGEAIQSYVNHVIHNKRIENFKIPFIAVATDIQTGESVLFSKGDAGLAVRASSAVPGLFQPVKIGDHQYVDGGLTAPVPVQVARKMGADIIIAVNISADPEHQNANTTTEILLQTFAIMSKKINQYALREADVVITPDLAGMKSSDFTRRAFAINAGERATNQLIPEILRKIQDKRTKMNQ